ncbi:amino acid permease [Streptomyces sp. NBC_00564]|nr:amino acid permease [Streptomyces sp. NBC_00564]
MTQADVEAKAPPAAKLTLLTLTTMVVGSMVGAGVFSLPRRFAQETGVAGALIAWAVAGTGMLMLAFVFQRLAIRRPDLDAGVYAYAKAGFGEYLGFFSAFGYRTFAQCSTLQGGGEGHPWPSGSDGRRATANVGLSDNVVGGPTAGRAGSHACGDQVRPLLTERHRSLKQEPTVVSRQRYGPESSPFKAARTSMGQRPRRQCDVLGPQHSGRRRRRTRAGRRRYHIRANAYSRHVKRREGVGRATVLEFP